ncbi:MAG TPA: hypothetical protein VGQ83_32865 [Polyangia bacterium]|jgi:hypothetical protein
MLDLLTHREEIQRRATEELGRRFKDYDINCVAVLIGRPETNANVAEDPIERLFDQLRQRRLAEEQMATYGTQEQAALTLKDLHHAEALAGKQTELTQTGIDVAIAGNRGEAQLAEARRLAERDVVCAGAASQARELVGRGEAARVAAVGQAEAAVLEQKNRAYGDPRLLALAVVAEKLAQSAQPLVPERLFVTGDGATGGAGGRGLLAQLIGLLVAERAGFALEAGPAALPPAVTPAVAAPDGVAAAPAAAASAA